MKSVGMGDEERRAKVLSLLQQTYPHAKVALTYSSAWELLVAVILSAQCTDVAVNKCTQKLFTKYPTLDAYVLADPAEFEKDLSSIIFYKNKAKFILANAKTILEKFGGQVPQSMEELLTLKGVARKTANVILSTIYNIYVGIVVDTHVLRISQRLGLVSRGNIGGKSVIIFEKNGQSLPDFVKDADAVRVESELIAVIPKDQWKNISMRLIDHGRALCKAVGPKCDQCPLCSVCPASRV